MKRFLDSSTSQPEAFTCHTGSPIPDGKTSLDIAPRYGDHDRWSGAARRRWSRHGAAGVAGGADRAVGRPSWPRRGPRYANWRPRGTFFIGRPSISPTTRTPTASSGCARSSGLPGPRSTPWLGAGRPSSGRGGTGRTYPPAARPGPGWRPRLRGTPDHAELDDGAPQSSGSITSGRNSAASSSETTIPDQAGRRFLDLRGGRSPPTPRTDDTSGTSNADVGI